MFRVMGDITHIECVCLIHEEVGQNVNMAMFSYVAIFQIGHQLSHRFMEQLHIRG